jgi:nitrate reductase delta subunit
MNATQTERALLASFGALLEYPHVHLGAQARELLDELASLDPAAHAHLEAFIEAVERGADAEIEEHYTRAFDLAPQAVPYLSVYLFGAEGTQRGPFMAGLKKSYDEHGFDAGHELPDHVATVLRYALAAPEEEWTALRAWCVPPPVKQMARDLEHAQNLYRHVLHALVCVLALPTEGEPEHV